MEPGQKLRKAREDAGLTQDQLAERMGWSGQNRVSNYELGRRPFPFKDLQKLASVLGRNQGYFIDDTGTITTIARAAEAAAVLAVPVLEASASMGNGRPQPEHDTIVGTLPLSRGWVSQNLRGVSSADNLAVITALGDSMEPTFRDGDMLLVDRGVTEVRIDSVFVLALNDELFIKRLQRDPLTGSLRMLSDNKLNHPIEITAADMSRFQVLGRVVWAWNGKRL
ncbi:MAG: helix-turn-helix transcriptional regulator [Rhodospirillales bacterium]